MKKILFIVFVSVAATTAVKAQTSALPAKPNVIIDNNKVKVTAYDSQPGKDICGIGKHSHPAHLTVLLTDATVKITTADGKIVEHKVPAGAAFWNEAETHTVINNGDKQVKAYIIETKN